ncbi:T6SS effector phospholipase Tle3 domain-containing protein, partial [Herbaspirillum huttiense]
MAHANDEYHVIGEGAAVTFANRGNDRPAELPRDLPGIVIFIHGVNDPGAVYSFVEEGLCQGLNERLDRKDLKPGSYGAQYKEIKVKKNPGTLDQDKLSDPDTYLYQRNEIAGSTKSVFIPFYWGYRAQNDEIARFDSKGKSNTAEVKGGVDDGQGFQTIRGQYQDIHGNRLDKHFGKAGGFFANATNNIPDMYGAGFRADWKTRRV